MKTLLKIEIRFEINRIGLCCLVYKKKIFSQNDNVNSVLAKHVNQFCYLAVRSCICDFVTYFYTKSIMSRIYGV